MKKNDVRKEAVSLKKLEIVAELRKVQAGADSTSRDLLKAVGGPIIICW